jgi:glycosyltransferase involved in cell wall biosynthesis
VIAASLKEAADALDSIPGEAATQSMTAPTAPVPVLLMAQELTHGGSERQLAETAKALDRRRFQPHVAVMRRGGIRYEELIRAGIPVEVFPLRSFASPKLPLVAWRFGRFLRRQRFQLVHSFDTPANVFAAPVARAFGVPVILSSQRAFRELSPRHLLPLLRLSDRLANGVVVNCESVRRHLMEAEGVRPSMIHVCYNGIDAERFARRSVRLPENLAGASLIVGVVCALRPEKGLPTLLRAFELARKTHAGLRLVIVGGGEMLEPLERLAGELQLGGDCVFAPSTPNVAEWLSMMDVFVLPSLSEALSNSLMEAMACGCAVIASATGGNPELVAHEERGLLFERGNVEDLARQITRMAAGAEERRRMASAGRDFIRSGFTLRRAAERMSEIYEEMLGAKRGSGGAD